MKSANPTNPFIEQIKKLDSLGRSYLVQENLDSLINGYTQISENIKTEKTSNELLLNSAINQL